jgi:hypothetical protein
MYDFTVGIAQFRPLTPLQRLLFTSMRTRPAEITRFLGAFAGITPIDAYLSVPNAARVIATSWWRPAGPASPGSQGRPGHRASSGAAPACR